jgi:hypothetical protein
LAGLALAIATELALAITTEAEVPEPPGTATGPEQAPANARTEHSAHAKRFTAASYLLEADPDCSGRQPRGEALRA